MQLTIQWYITAKSIEELAMKQAKFNLMMSEDYIFDNIGKQGNQWVSWFRLPQKKMVQAQKILKELSGVKKDNT